MVREQRELLGYYDTELGLGASDEDRHCPLAPLLSVTRQGIAAAHGDSNDEEIESLWSLVAILMEALKIEGEIRP